MTRKITDLQRVAAQVVKVEMELMACQHIVARMRELEDPELIEVAETDLALTQAMLDSEILALRTLGGLEGIETEDGAVLRAWLIVSDAIVTDRDIREV